MSERACGVCGEPVTTRARFCSACGVDLDASLILDPVEPLVGDKTTSDRRNLTTLLVPVGLALVVGLIVLALVTGGDDGTPDDGERPDVVAAPTATPLPTPTATPFRVTLPDATPPQPTPTRTPAAPLLASVDTSDLSALPPVDASHLAVAHDRDLAYLDLETGEWIIHERVNMSSVPAVDSLTPFADGVVTDSGEALFYIPVDDRPQVLAPGERLGVVDGLFWARIWDADGPPEVIGFDQRGDRAARFVLPPQSWVVDVLDSGVFLIEAGGRLFTHVGNRTDLVATGNFAGAHGDRILVFTCAEDLESCRHVLIDVVAGSQFDVQVPIAESDTMRLTPDGRILVWEGFGASAIAYQLDANGTVVIREELQAFEANQVEFGLSGEATATDTSGLSARVEGDQLVFSGPAGEAITEVALDFLPGFGDSYALTFVTVDG